MSNKFTINCEDGQVEKALVDFFDQYQDNLKQHIEMTLRREGEESDPQISVKRAGNKTEVIALRNSTDKRNIIVVDPKEGTATFADYDKLKEGDRYLQEGTGNWNLYLKEVPNTPDARLGHFKTMKEGIVNIYSPQVDQAIEGRRAMLEAEKKEDEASVEAEMKVVETEK